MAYPRQVWNAKSKFRMMTKKRDQLLLLQTMSSRRRWRWTIPETAGERAASRSALFVAGKLNLPTGICKSNRSMPVHFVRLDDSCSPIGRRPQLSCEVNPGLLPAATGTQGSTSASPLPQLHYQVLLELDRGYRSRRSSI